MYPEWGGLRVGDRACAKATSARGILVEEGGSTCLWTAGATGGTSAGSPPVQEDLSQHLRFGDEGSTTIDAAHRAQVKASRKVPRSLLNSG
jgi:hypothetical protein